MDIWSFLSADALARTQGPLAVRLQHLLRAAIAVGCVAPGQTLPAERLIAERTGLSRVTVRRAVTALVREGTMFSVRGSGNYVAFESAKKSDTRAATSATCEIANTGERHVGSECVSFDVHDASTEEKFFLGIPSSKVIRLTVVISAGAERIAVARSVLPLDAMPFTGLSAGQMLAAFERLQARLERTFKRIYACHIDAADAELLGLPEGSLGLVMQSISYLPSGRPVAFTQSVHRGDECECLVEQHFQQTPPSQPAPVGGGKPSKLQDRSSGSSAHA